jgi:predicted amidohydrolase YtcJ
MIKLGAQKLLRVGVTSATDPAVHPELLEAYYELYHEGELPIRMNLMPILLPDGGNKPYPIPEKFKSDWLTVNTVKFFSDGGLSGKTAAIKRPYRNSTDTGILRLNREYFLSLAKEAQQKGFRVGTHAIGDVAVDLVIDVYKELHKQFGNTRNRIEHFGLPSDANINDVAQFGFVPVPQAIFLDELGENFINSLDDEYLMRCYPVNTLLNMNIPVAFSTDAPVVKNVNPWSGIKASVTRETSNRNVISAQEAITVEQAIHAYTVGSAFAEVTEMQKGSIESGKLADFIVLDRNPLDLAVNEIETLKISATYINGNCAYQHN